MNINSVKSRYNKKSQKNKSMSFDKKVVQQNAQKPPYSYAELIAQAIISVPSYKLPLNKIYEWISTHYPFYKLSETGWQNSIRHNLSLNNSFVKCPRTEEDPGKGCYWTIVKDQRQKFESQLSKKLGTSINIIKKSNPKKKYNTYSDSESDLSESDFEEDEDDYPYTDKIIIKQKKVRKNSSRSSDDMLYTEKPKSNKKSKKLAKAVKKTTVPASPTPSPILTKRDGNFSDVKSYDEESEEESENMMMDEESEDDYEAYPPSPQSPDFPPIHLHKKYDFSFDLFSENPKLDDEDDDNEDSNSLTKKYDMRRLKNRREERDINDIEEEDEEMEIRERGIDDEEFDDVMEEDEEEEEDDDEFDFENENQDPLPTIKISKSAVSLYDDLQNRKDVFHDSNTTTPVTTSENNTPGEMINIPKEMIHEKDDDVNVLEQYNNTYLTDHNDIDHNYNCYIDDEIDKQYNYYLHSPIFNCLTCPELADMCFGVNLNNLDYTSLNENFQNIPDKLDFVEMGVENWWRDESNTYPIY